MSGEEVRMVAATVLQEGDEACAIFRAQGRQDLEELARLFYYEVPMPGTYRNLRERVTVFISNGLDSNIGHKEELWAAIRLHRS